MKVKVKHYEEITEDDFTTLKNGQKVLTRDIKPVTYSVLVGGGKGKKPVREMQTVMMWDKTPRDVKRIKGKFYLVTEV